MKIKEKYTIIKKLSETTSNIVYSAKDKKTGKDLVIKVLKDESESAVLDFKKEFSILHTLNHPNIVKVFEFGSFSDDGKDVYYFTMEFVKGQAFNTYFRLKGLSNFPVLFKELLETVQYVHKKGFIHGDLKSNHVIVTPENGIKLVDFGFAQIKERVSESDIGGTLEYIAPELLSGELPDERSDIYSLGIIAYESVLGVSPFKGMDISDLIKSKFNNEIDKNSLITIDIPGYMKDAIVKMVAKEPLDRFKDVREISDYITNEGNVVKRRIKIDKILNYPFVGRKKFVNYTRRVVGDEKRKHGGIIIYEGPEGIGKTAILKEFEFSFIGTGIETYFIDLQNYEKNTVDWMLDILRNAKITVKDIETMIEAGEFEFSGVEKYKFYDIIVEKLLHLPGDIRRLFLIDNIKKDNPFFDFIPYLSHYLDNTSVYFIFSSSEVSKKLRSLIRNGVFKYLDLFELKHLSKYDIRIIVANMLGVKGNVNALADYIYKISQGVPYFAIEYLKEIINQCDINEEQGNLIYNMTDVRKISLPSSVIDMYKMSLRHAGQNLLRVMNTIAVYKFPVRYDLLKKLSNLTESEIVKIINDKHFKNYISFGSGKFYFKNDKLRDYIYDSMETEERNKIHNDIISLFKDKNKTIFVLKVLSYNALATDSPDAKTYLIELIKRAEERREANDVIDAFLKLYRLDDRYALENLGTGSLIKIANSLVKSGNYDLSSELLNNALKKTKSDDEKVGIMQSSLMIKVLTGETENIEESYKEMLKLTLSHDRKFETLLNLGWYYYENGNPRKARKIYREADKISKNLADKTLKGKLLYNLAVLEMTENDYKNAFEYARELVAFANNGGYREYLYAGMNLMANIFQYKRQYILAAQHYEELLKLMEESIDVNRKLRILVNLTKMLLKTGKIEESKSYYFKAIAEAKKLGRRLDIAALYNIFASILLREGYWNNALEYFDKSLNMAMEIDERGLEKDNILGMLRIYGYRENGRKMDKLIRITEGIAENVKSLREKVPVDLIYGIYFYMDKNYDDSLERLDAIIDSLERAFLPEYQVPALILKAEIKYELNMLRVANATIDKASRIIRKTGLQIYENEIEFLKILLAEEVTDKTEMQKKFEDLIDKIKSGDRFLYARVLLRYADFIRSVYPLNDKVTLMKLVGLLEDARIIFEDLSLKHYTIDIDSKLIELYKRIAESKGNILGYNYSDIIFEFINIMRNISEPEKLKSSFINLAKKFTGAERGMFISLDADTGELIPVGKDMDKSTEEDIKKISRSIIKKATKGKEPIIVSDALVDSKFKRFESIKLNKIHSILVVPVISDSEVWGVLYLDSRKKAGVFSENEKQLFSLLTMLLAKTLENAQEYNRIKEESRVLKESLRTKFGPVVLVGQSKKMQEVYEKIDKFSKSDVPILILGESGTGKEVTAKNIHYLSSRKDKNFLVVDCSSLSQSLIESELFGYKKGSFTGAKEDKIGHFEAAEKGTLFIDEISNASESLQARLLRFLDTQEVKKIGTTKYRKVDTRIIVASNMELYDLVKMGKFRSDLFFRLSRFVITLPPLRERKEDIRLLIDYFIDMFNKRYNKKIKGVTKEAFSILYGYDWPGNVRELKNEIDKCVFFCNEKYITPQYISGDIKHEENVFIPLREMKKELIKKYIDSALKFTNGDISKAAELLDTDKATIYRYKRNYKNK